MLEEAKAEVYKADVLIRKKQAELKMVCSLELSHTI
jgi:hypothetical protein